MIQPPLPPRRPARPTAPEGLRRGLAVWISGAFCGGVLAGALQGGLVSLVLWSAGGMLVALLSAGYAPERLMSTPRRALLGLGICVGLPAGLAGRLLMALAIA